ncbi:MAG: hypothetical protein IKG04_02585 [Exiguobacterium sp.]|nr:hypothetical protein [Exiguobacterium sp.]
MRFRGCIHNLTIDYATGGAVVSLIAEDKTVLRWAEELKGKDVSVELKEWKEKRSLNQNDLWHKLLGLLADALGNSRARQKNIELFRYGQYDTINGRLVTFIVRDDLTDVLYESEEYHLKPTDQTKEMNGDLYRVYFKVKGSHELNTAEMAKLMDGTIADCKEAGINVDLL